MLQWGRELTPLAMAHHVRVRYAPSPTGEPHVGNIRTAIFTWLFVRNQGGRFIVRIEDTDVARRVEGATEAILEALRWLDLDWDEGPDVGGPYEPYVQSQRLSLYHQAAERLVQQQDAYDCYCSPQRLEEVRREQQQRKEPPRYDRRCRNLSTREREALQAQKIKPVVRFKMPLEGTITFPDLIRGDVTFDFAVLDDFVVLKSDGYPTYHLASVVDDHLMEITHVMRAEEWLPSAPRHQQLYRALGYEMPQFAHLPIILGPDRSKLSKRHGATSALEYRRMGYLPEAMLNFLVLLGWSLDDHTEVISRKTLVKQFSLERIGTSAAIFNEEKLTWLNGVYIRSLPAEELAERLLPFLEAGLPPSVPRPLDRGYLQRIVPLIQERIKTLAEVSELASFFFLDSLDYDPHLLIQKEGDPESTLKSLSAVVARLEPLPQFDVDAIEEVLRPLAEELGLKTGHLFGAVRVAVTGSKAAPPLFATMEVLGRERCLARLKAAVEELKAVQV